MSVKELLAKWLLLIEGEKLAPYRDSKGVWTAGRGHTKGVTEHTIVTPALVDQWFEEDQAPLLKVVDSMSVLEGAMYGSFGFNCGLAALERVLGGVSRLEDFIYSGKKPVLRARRDVEEALIAVSRMKS